MTYFGKIVTFVLGLPIRSYQLLISPVMAPSCRFAPNCSEYALQAIGRFGPVRGCWLALRRIARCHPWGGQGLDPVPEIADSHAGPGRR